MRSNQVKFAPHNSLFKNDEELVSKGASLNKARLGWEGPDSSKQD